MNFKIKNRCESFSVLQTYINNYLLIIYLSSCQNSCFFKKNTISYIVNINILPLINESIENIIVRKNHKPILDFVKKGLLAILLEIILFN